MKNISKKAGYLIVLSFWFIVGSAFCVDQYRYNKQEITNTAEDMIEWIVEDVANGYVDSTRADSYIDNLEEIIKRNK